MRKIIAMNVVNAVSVVRPVVRIDIVGVAVRAYWSLSSALWGLLKGHAGLLPAAVPVSAGRPIGERRTTAALGIDPFAAVPMLEPAGIRCEQRRQSG